MKERSSLIDILKGVAIIAVLLGHSIIVYPINIQEISFWGKPLTYFVGSFHMCLFLLIFLVQIYLLLGLFLLNLYHFRTYLPLCLSK